MILFALIEFLVKKYTLMRIECTKLLCFGALFNN